MNLSRLVSTVTGVVVLLGLAALPSCDAGSETPRVSADEEAVLKCIADYHEALSTGDTAALQRTTYGELQGQFANGLPDVLKDLVTPYEDVHVVRIERPFAYVRAVLRTEDLYSIQNILLYRDGDRWAITGKS